jgi:hypothetical protein
MNNNITFDNLSHDIQRLIYKYSFNFCNKCKNKYISRKEMVKCIDNTKIYKCSHCIIYANLENPKCRYILGISPISR